MIADLQGELRDAYSLEKALKADKTKLEAKKSE